MKLAQFVSATDLLAAKEIEKVRLLAFFHLKESQLAEFSTNDVATWFDELGLAAPNRTRLRRNIGKSKAFVQGNGAKTHRLHAREIATLEAEHPALNEKSEEIVSTDEVLPDSLCLGTRGYIEKLSQQINASYEYNIFDGCAVLMRRLIEVLLIHSYEAFSIDSQIKNADGNYKSLSKIISDAEQNKTLALSKIAKASLDDFRTLGNFSAHQIHYTARRSDVKKEIANFRVTVEELLYKSGIKT